MKNRAAGRNAPAPVVAVTLLALALSTAACASRSRDTSDSPADRGPTVVEVDNGNFADVVVYALSTGQYYRLGEVTGHDRANLTLPQNLNTVNSLRLVADPIGSSNSYFSEQILFGPGDILVLRVGPTMNLSSVSVRGGRSGGDR